LVQLKRQAIGIGEERESFAGVLIGTDGFSHDATGSQMGNGHVEVRNGKGKVSQTEGFRARRTTGRVWK